VFGVASTVLSERKNEGPELFPTGPRKGRSFLGAGERDREMGEFLSGLAPRTA